MEAKRTANMEGFHKRGYYSIFGEAWSWVMGIYCGLPFDKLVKLLMSGISLGRPIHMKLPLKTKNRIISKSANHALAKCSSRGPRALWS
jgi:hypothetical protein